MTAPPGEGFRLSPEQRRLWWMPGASRAFRAACALRIRGVLDEDALRRGLHQLVRAHGILRTRFVSVAGLRTPLQVVDEDASFGWRTADVHEAGIAPILREDREAVDVRQGPVVRASLLRLRDEEHVLGLTLPALCADGSSLPRLMHALGRAYAHALAGTVLDAESLAYVRFAEWRNEPREGDDPRGGAPRESGRAAPVEAPPLALESLPADEGDYEAAAHVEVLSGELAGAVSACAARLDAPEAALMLAAWSALLWRLGGRDQVTVGVRTDGRDHELLQDGIGLFARYVPVAARLGPSLRFEDLVRRLVRGMEEAAAADDDVIESGAPPSFAFACESWPGPLQVGPVSFSFMGRYVCLEPARLQLAAVRTADGLETELLYDARRFRPDAVRYVARLLRTLVEGAVDSPGAPLASLPMLDEAGRRQAIALGRGPARPIEDACIHRAFERRVRRSPEAIALVFGADRLTYGQLNVRANRLALRLRGIGAGPEVRVGLLAERSLEMIVGLLAILKSGAACLPLDPYHPPLRLAGILEEGRPAAALVQEGLRARLPAGTPALLLGRAEAGGEGMAALDLEGADLPDSLAYVMYTSGSSGRPKGVMVAHRSVMNLAAALASTVYGGTERPLRVGLNAPLSFDASVKQWVQLLYGHTLHILSEEARSTPEALRASLDREPLDALDCTPTQLAAWLAGGLDREGPLPQRLLIGGEPLDDGTWRRLASHPGTRCYNVYGPTECTVDVTAARVEGGAAHAGRPLQNVRVCVLDRDLQPLPLGVAGELHVGGAGVARGYLARPEATAASFVPDPHGEEPGARLYRTGDAARFLPDGTLQLLGRLDLQVKIRGVRVELPEVEAVLKTHAAVRDAAVILRNDAAGRPALVSFVSLRPGADAGSPAESVRRLREFLRERLPEPMVPADIVLMDALPVNRNGKVDRPFLTSRPLAGRGPSGAPVSPRNELERTIAAVWRELLQVDAVGIHDNWFDLGGHSLLMVRAYGRLRELTGREFTLIDLFRHPSVVTLAAYLAEGEAPVPGLEIEARAAKRRQARQRRREGAARAARAKAAEGSE